MELLLLSRSTNREMAKRKKKGMGVGVARPGNLAQEGVEKREQRGRVGKRGRERNSEIAREGRGRQSQRETGMDDVVSGDEGLF